LAVYRESPSIWRRYLPVIIGVVVLVALALIIFVLSRSSSGGPTDQIGQTLDVIGQSVDVFAIEFAKVAKGTPPAQTGAPGAIDRALTAFAGSESDLRKLHESAAGVLAKDLAALKAALDAPSTNVDNLLADVSVQLLAIRRARQSTPAR
jgi:hypothetical protein